MDKRTIYIVVAVFVAESGGPRFRQTVDLEATLGVPALAMVPRLEPARLAGATPQDYVLERPRSRYAEALRTLLAWLIRPPATAGVTRLPPHTLAEHSSRYAGAAASTSVSTPVSFSTSSRSLAARTRPKWKYPTPFFFHSSLPVAVSTQTRSARGIGLRTLATRNSRPPAGYGSRHDDPSFQMGALRWGGVSRRRA